MRLTRITAGLLGAALLVGACGRGGGSASERKVPFQNVTQDGEVSIEVTGAKQATFKKPSTLQILTADGPDDVDVMVVGTSQGVDAGDNVTLEAFVQLTSYKGNGKYTAGATNETKPTKLANSAYVQYVRRPPGGEVEVVRYDLVRKACDFVIEKDGSKGSAHCRGLASNNGDEVVLRMKWNATGPRTPISTTTTTTTPSGAPSSSTP